jgi:hypothetical protein
VGFLAFSCQLLAQGGPLVARAASVAGAAVVYTGNSGGTFVLSAGFFLNPGDRVDTRGGGRVAIELSDGSMVVVEPQSVLVFKDFRQADSLRELFEILVGSVRVKINHFGGRPNPYRMNSPTASIAVRGTDFTIEVAPSGDTQVTVYEGIVEVTSLSDPTQSILVEAGRGVLVQAGQDFHLLGGTQNPLPAAAANLLPGNVAPAAHSDRDTVIPRAVASAYDNYIAGLSDIAQIPFLLRFNAFAEGTLDSLENPAYATQFETLEARVFLLPTFGGGPDLDDHLTSLGPAGTLPSTYSVSPQLSLFSPIGRSNFFLGGSLSGSHLSDSGLTSFPNEDPLPTGQSPTLSRSSGSSSSNFYSGSLVAARRLGASSIGLELESLRGNGSLTSTTIDGDSQVSVGQISAVSTISQMRLTAGLSHDFGQRAKLGVFYRYGWISANDQDLSHTINNMPAAPNSTNTTGHFSEIGFRLRGAIRPRLLYGVTGAWQGISLADGLVRTGTVNSSERDRGALGSVGLGVGYLLSPRIVLTFDAAAGTSRLAASRTEDATGNLLQNGTANGHFISSHAAVQINLSHHLFTSVSFLNVWHAQHLNVNLFPDQFGNTSLVQDSFFPLIPSAYQVASHFSDFGIGWRFANNAFIQYLFTTNYAVTNPTHTIMLGYGFELHRAE